MRKRRRPPRRVRDPSERQQFDGARMRGLSRDVVVSQNRLGNLIANGVHGRECRQRILEDHRDAPAANVRQLAIGQPHQVALTKTHRPGHARVRGQQSHDRQRRYRLARPRLADNSQHFAGTHLVRNAAHRGHVASLAAERHRKVFNVQNRSFVSSCLRGCGRGCQRGLPGAALGSSASRRASPTRLIDSTSTTSDAAGK